MFPGYQFGNMGPQFMPQAGRTTYTPLFGPVPGEELDITQLPQELREPFDLSMITQQISGTEFDLRLTDLKRAYLLGQTAKLGYPLSNPDVKPLRRTEEQMIAETTPICWKARRILRWLSYIGCLIAIGCFFFPVLEVYVSYSMCLINGLAFPHAYKATKSRYEKLRVYTHPMIEKPKHAEFLAVCAIKTCIVFVLAQSETSPLPWICCELFFELVSRVCCLALASQEWDQVLLPTVGACYLVFAGVTFCCSRFTWLLLLIYAPVWFFSTLATNVCLRDAGNGVGADALVVEQHCRVAKSLLSSCHWLVGGLKDPWNN